MSNRTKQAKTANLKKAVNGDKKSPHITKITANSTPKELDGAEKKPLKASRKNAEERPIKSYFILARPFVALGRYLRDSWREIRQVRWPNRKATWKMTLAVLVYVALFMIFLTLIDVFFTFIFDLLFKQ